MSNSINAQSIHEELSFHRLQNNNLKLFLMQTEQQTQERQIVNTRRGRFDTEKSSSYPDSYPVAI